MSAQRPGNISLPPRRTFGPQDTPEAEQNDSPGPSGSTSLLRKVFSRISLRGSRRGSSTMHESGSGDVEAGETPNQGHRPSFSSIKPPIPTMGNTPGELYTTPLPTLSMIVLSITMLGEFLSANVSTPFLLFMVKGFGQVKTDSEVAFWTGVIVSTFFATQFLTSLLWATVAEKHGRRAVLIASLLGSSITCLIFGTATTLKQAIAIRLLQGIFAGAVGVARGSVAFVTDATNEGRAYAILGFCWGMGGVAGAIIGGAFERPADKWPSTFENYPLFTKYPYLLPCAVAAGIMLIGALLACFLSRDGGPREGAIRLGPEKLDPLHPAIPEEEEVSLPPSPLIEARRPSFITAVPRKISQKISGLFNRGGTPHESAANSPGITASTSVPLSSTPNLGAGAGGTRLERTRTFSNRYTGSAYGYSSGNYRRRLSSNATARARAGSSGMYDLRRRRGSQDPRQSLGGEAGGEMNFAQRLLMANENAVTGIADLWVAAAMNVDNEDVFELDSEDEDALEVDESPALGEGLGEGLGVDEGGFFSGEGDNESQRIGLGLGSHRPSGASARPPPTFGSPLRPSRSRQSNVESPRVGLGLPRSTSIPFQPGTPGSRRPSTTAVPAIFSHVGVRTPPAVLESQAQQLLERTDQEDNQALIHDQTDVESLSEKQPSLWGQIPKLVVVQYGMLALHTTTHDQVFMSYLVTDYEGGGLNLNPGHFAQLIALMCLAQIAYQFYLYPNIGPPRGRFSHLAMFRVGSLLFVPAYLSVVLYRPFASATEDGNVFVMALLALSTAIRYCGITFGYTAISILLNYMTPPSAVGIANGIAQSIVSLARCVGPVMGGYLWSASIQDSPSGYPLGFLVCAGFCAFSVLHSYLIR